MNNKQPSLKANIHLIKKWYWSGKNSPWQANKNEKKTILKNKPEKSYRISAKTVYQK